MKTLKLNFIEPQLENNKEKIYFGVNDNLFEIQILADDDDILTVTGELNVVNKLRNQDISSSLFVKEIESKKYETPSVRYMSFQLNNNVDKQQLTKLTVSSSNHNHQHIFYFISDKL